MEGGAKDGYYLGPTIIDHVTLDMRIAKEEVFGPVITIIRTKDLDAAIAIENANPYGNAAAVFTQSGGQARQVMERASAGMIGVNIGVPVPREPFSFGGWNDSKFGTCDITVKRQPSRVTERSVSCALGRTWCPALRRRAVTARY